MSCSSREGAREHTALGILANAQSIINQSKEKMEDGNQNRSIEIGMSVERAILRLIKKGDIGVANIQGLGEAEEAVGSEGTYWVTG